MYKVGSSLVATETSGGSPVRLEANPTIFERHCMDGERGSVVDDSDGDSELEVEEILASTESTRKATAAHDVKKRKASSTDLSTAEGTKTKRTRTSSRDD